MSEVVKKMIDAIAGDDKVASETEFKSALSSKVGQALDDRRKDLAATILSKSTENNKGNDTDAKTTTEIDNWKRRT